MAGLPRLMEIVSLIRGLVPCEVDMAMQTNGTLLTAPMLDFLSHNEIKIGLSIDGDQGTNDHHRHYRNGAGSFSRVMRGIELINSKPEWRSLLGGFLAVIDLGHPPSEVFSFLRTLGGRGFDVLLPDCNHDAPPHRPASDESRIAYGQWMSEFFDAWLDAEEDIEIRYFEEIMSMLFGQVSTLEAIGARNVDLIVIESNGDIEAVDTLKTVSREATSLGMNVETHSFDDALSHPAVYSRMLGFSALCDECQACPHLDICGGGYLPHRYSTSNHFLNPSVYCHDIQFLIEHIKRRLSEKLPNVRF